MIPRLVVLISVALALAGCVSEAPPATSVVPVAYAINAELAGPITATTPYSRSAIQKLFPGQRVEVIQTAEESGIVSALTVFQDGLQTLMILPDSSGSGIRAVHGAGLAVAGPGGERLGMTFGELGMSRSDCRVGGGPWAGMAICKSRDAPNVTLVFDNGGWKDPTTLAPASSLKDGDLQRIVWTPPRA